MCDAYDWAAVDPSSWNEFPFIEQRFATEEDVRCGRAVFYVEGKKDRIFSEFKLPLLARLKNEDGTTDKIIVIQIEFAPGAETVVVGYRCFSGGNGIATLPEIEVIEEGKF